MAAGFSFDKLRTDSLSPDSFRTDSTSFFFLAGSLVDGTDFGLTGDSPELFFRQRVSLLLSNLCLFEISFLLEGRYSVGESNDLLETW